MALEHAHRDGDARLDLVVRRAGRGDGDLAHGVGEEQAVFAATRRLEEAVDKLEAEAGERGSFLDEIIMHEVLSELRDIAQRGGVSCTCGSTDWNLQVNYSSVDLICARCGGTLRIPAATASDLDDICCKHKLVIRAKE